MVPAPAGLRDRRRVGARRHARARSRNRVGSRATHPLSTGGATPNAPASAVTTSFFSSSTFICCISAAAASAISALEVRSARCVGGFGGKRRAAERKIRPRLASKKTAVAVGAIVKVYRDLYSSTTTVCNSVVFESSATNRGGKPGVVSDPGDHGYRRARGVEQPAPPSSAPRASPTEAARPRAPRARRARARSRTKEVRLCFSRTVEHARSGTDTSHAAATGMACRSDTERRGTREKWNASAMGAIERS